MALEPGTRLGPYEIQSALGAGGMGEVYRAHDTRLNRVVAIKVMPPHFADDPEMKQRFDREAQTIASLSHPNICVLHDVGTDSQAGGTATPALSYLVMEYVEGETLEQRLERARAPGSGLGSSSSRRSGAGTGSGRSGTKLISRGFTVEEAMAIGIQIAEALDKAHRHGIVHRDLKPANVMLLHAGVATAPQVKLLDFGLAKWKAPVESLASAVTIQADLTMKGAVLGTIRYMAPEQLEGAEADARTDIFAFGTILYELLTGRKAFDGKNQPSLAGAIMTSEPVSIARLQPKAPPALERIVERCLSKDPDERWQTAHDLLIQLRWVAQGGAGAEEAGAAASPKAIDRLALVGIGLGALLTIGAAWPAYQYIRGSEPPDPIQFRVPAFGLQQASISVSPDGALMALVIRPNSNDTAALYVRPVGAVTFRRVVGSEEAAMPFWSPDSKSIAFVANGRLKRVEAAGGAPRDLGDATGFTGGSWSTANAILFGTPAGVRRVSAEGGQPELVTKVEKPFTGHFWPYFLPDGRHYLYLAWSDDASKRGVMAGSLDSTDAKIVMAGVTNVAYTSSGHLFFHRDGSVFAQPFDASSRTLDGAAVQIAGDVAFNPSNGRSSFDVSQTGVFLYFQGGGGSTGRAGTMPVAVYGWRDRGGSILSQVGEQGPYGDVDLSPNGRLVAITRQDAGASGADIWVTDWERNVTQKLTLDPADDLNPVWAPDNRRVAFTTFRSGSGDIYVMNADGRGDAAPILATPADEWIEDWSKDGKFIAYRQGPDEAQDLFVAPLGDDGKAGKPLLVAQGKYRKDEAQFSYDGKWLAYVSDESGTFHVYVVSLPDLKKHQVTPPEGGGQPRWRADGKELYYRAFDNRAMVVEMTLGDTATSGVPRPLFIGSNVLQARDPTRHQWSVTPDGKKFLTRLANNSGTTGGTRSGGPVAPLNFNVVAATGGAASTPSVLSNGLTVLIGWPAALAKAAK